MIVNIPSEIEALRDAAVAFVHGPHLNCPDLKPLEDWFENGQGWDEVVMSVEGGVVCLDSVADRYFSNSELRDYVDLPPKARISKALKLEYARSRLEYEFLNTDDSIHAVAFPQFSRQILLSKSERDKCKCKEPNTQLNSKMRRFAKLSTGATLSSM